MANKNKLTVSQIAKRAGITARELRDVVTAVSTAAASVPTKKDIKNANYKSGYSDMAKKNLKTQIKEVGAAAVKGKKGTPSDVVKPGMYSGGKKRK